MERRFQVKASTAAGLLGRGLSPASRGLPRDFEVYYPASPERPRDNSLVFARGPLAGRLDAWHAVRDCVILVPESAAEDWSALGDRHLVIPVPSPRLAYARLVSSHLEATGEAQSLARRPYRRLENGAVLGDNVTLGVGARIGPHAFVDHDVTLGDRTVVGPGARLRRWVEIGADSEIGENAVLGSSAFVFERDERGLPVAVPSLCGVRVGDHVEVGPLSTVDAGVVEATVVRDWARLDAHVYIGHDAVIGRRAVITAGVRVSGHVVVGDGARLGPNSAILQRLSVGEHAVVGMGAVVVHPVAPGSTVAGSPAVPTSRLRAFHDARERLLEAIAEGRL